MQRVVIFLSYMVVIVSPVNPGRITPTSKPT